MKISDKSKRESREFAQKFTRFCYSFCSEHGPDDLPIDAPAHREYFMQIVREEISRRGYKIEHVEESKRETIENALRNEFRDVYLSDERACVECYRERLECSESVGIRMEVPDSYDEIPIQ